MSNQTAYYEICIQLPGTHGIWHVLLRARTPEGAGEVVRILLAQDDPDLAEILIRRRHEI